MQSGVREAWKPGLRRTGIGMAVFALAWLWLSNRSCWRRRPTTSSN
ncbi:hypothetical protein WJ971_25710 [Achromobacter xylosoxidans]